MPGFGGGGFGGSGFGGFDWARQVLFELAPEIYRTADAEQGGLFEAYAAAQAASFMNLRQKIASFADLRDPRAVRTQYDEEVTLRLGALRKLLGPVEQGGLLGSVTALQEVSTVRGRFTFSDVGKELTISGSSIPGNNKTVLVTNIVGPTKVLTNPPLAPDAGPFKWELRKADPTSQQEIRVSVLAGDVASVTPGWVLTDGSSEFTVLKRTQFWEASDERKLLTLREGADGSITSTLRFSSPTAALTSKDVGRKITIWGSSNFHNEGKFEIVDVLSATEAILDSTELVQDLSGALVWALLRDPELVLQGPSTLLGTIEQEGEDGEITLAGPPAQFKSLLASFSSSDVGKLLTIHYPGDPNNGTYEVLGVLSLSEVTLDATLALAPGIDFHWELRNPTAVGDLTQVRANASSLITYLAQDFGIEIDTREEEEYQRRWVESVSRWINMKGVAEAYEFLSELTGFTARVAAMFRVSQEIYLATLAAGGVTYEVGEADLTRFGSDGSLNIVAGLVQFSSPTAVFWGGDIGRQIDVSGSGGGNDGLRTIVRVVNSTTVEFRLSDTMTGLSDPNNGSLEWAVVRLYAEEAPTIPVYDEIDVDLMTYLKGAAVFTVDKYCWDPLPSPWSTLLGAGDGTIQVSAVDPATGSSFPVTFIVTGYGDFEVVKGLGIGRWMLTDDDGVEYFLETVPDYPLLLSGSTGGFYFSLGNYYFEAPTGTFSAAHIGKVLLVDGAGRSQNNQAYYLSGLLTSARIRLASVHTPVMPDPKQGLITWRIVDPDQAGVDGSLTLAAPARFSAPTASFTAADVGKRIVITESGSGNDRTYTIAALVGPTSVDLEAYHVPVTPDANNGSLMWAMFSYKFEVEATQPPAIGPGTLQYLCAEQMTCDFCKSNKVMVEASTPYALEKGFERLEDRLAQVTPKHVELVENFGVVVTASLALAAELDSP